VASLVLGLIVWVIDETIQAYGRIRNERIAEHSIGKDELIDNASKHVDSSQRITLDRAFDLDIHHRKFINLK
jgi:hypothetical protein